MVTLTVMNLAPTRHACRWPRSGFDRFGRLVDVPWTKPGTGDLARLKYGYDLASNRTYRRDEVARSLSKKFDEFYTYDRAQRLNTANRGLLSADNTRMDTPTFGQTWQLDQTGNWDRFTEFDDQSASFSALDQSRVQNAANEITAIGASVGPIWSQPAFDRNGNMTSIPKPDDMTAAYSATYDAWNRLIVLLDGASTVASYRYDGMNRRISATVGGSTRDFYYSDQWQVLDERVGGASPPDRQSVWGIRYIDDLVLRDRSTTGILNERLYAMQDANWNVDAIVDVSAVVQERYAYTAYGMPIALDANFNVRSTVANFEWETRYAGYRWDAETSLDLARWRPLVDVLGKWLSRDPLRYDSGDANLYKYAGNRPLTLHDAMGLLSTLEDLLKLAQARCKGLAKEALSKLCCDWAKKESQNLDWLKDLPACPCKLPATDAEKKDWTDPIATPTHQNAICIRSNTDTDILKIVFAGKPGQQCCYDESGNLYTTGPKAGTPDKAAPFGVSDASGIFHTAKDIVPYLQCKDGGILDAYLSARPPNNANKCEKNPPDAPDLKPLKDLCP